MGQTKESRSRGGKTRPNKTKMAMFKFDEPAASGQGCS